MSKKNISIDYTSRDFASIRQDLEDFAKRYYPDTYKDFNRASFGSLMLDTVSYIGDILSFYIDYQTNETFLDSAVEYTNIVRLARQLGYKLETSPSSYGRLTFYVEIPAAATGLGPDTDLIPVLQAGSTFSSVGGGFYTLLSDVDFRSSTSQIVVGQAESTTGNPTTYIIRMTGMAVSGRGTVEEIEVGDFQRFRRVELGVSNVSNIIRVTDTEGNEYFEVDNLSQNIVYKAIPNRTASRSTVPNILKAVPVARRFTVETVDGKTFLQFGYGSETSALTDAIANPTEVVLDLAGRTYSTETNFDPTKIISTDKFGIGPSNTTLRVQYRFNTTSDVNAGVNTITSLANVSFKFANQGSLNPSQRSDVQASLEVSNEEAFVGSVALPSAEEIRHRAFSYFSTQNRAVTAEDYKALVYAMPPKYGMLKRASVIKDADEFKQNINIYVISETNAGKLTIANSTLKNNLRNWLLQYKMLSDTVDILDARIVNFAVKYEVMIDLNSNRFTVLSNCTSRLSKMFATSYDIGEPISISSIYNELNKVVGVIDATSVEVVLRSGGLYSSSNYNFDAALSPDGRRILAEPSIIFELKYPNLDIKGSTR